MPYAIIFYMTQSRQAEIPVHSMYFFSKLQYQFLNVTLYFDSFIAKTETASSDMEYIINTKLSGKGNGMHKNDKTATYSKRQISSDGGIVLPLFSSLPDKLSTAKKLMDIYRLDMVLFGYDYQIRDGKVIALNNEVCGQQ